MQLNAVVPPYMYTYVHSQRRKKYATKFKKCKLYIDSCENCLASGINQPVIKASGIHSDERDRIIIRIMVRQ